LIALLSGQGRLASQVACHRCSSRDLVFVIEFQVHLAWQSLSVARHIANQQTRE